MKCISLYNLPTFYEISDVGYSKTVQLFVMMLVWVIGVNALVIMPTLVCICLPYLMQLLLFLNSNLQMGRIEANFPSSTDEETETHPK